MTYRPIENYGVIGDMHSAALVSTDGSIDWLCFPRFDSPSVFAAVLDDQKGGHFRVAPIGEFSSEQSYEPGTNILVTRFTKGEGVATLTDFMPMELDLNDCPHQLVREVVCESGGVAFEMRFEPRLDYARTPTAVDVRERIALARNGDHCLSLVTNIPMDAEDGAATASFTVREGDRIRFMLHWEEADPPEIADAGVEARLATTRRFWTSVSEDWDYEGRWRDVVQRSMLAMHLLIYVPSGAICAAATTSLPEAIGGVRNWDYRFSWPRDAAFTCDVFNRLGHTTYTKPFLHWLGEQMTNGPEAHVPHSLYPIDVTEDEHDMVELTLEHLEGYCQSPPVRVGNAAYHQFQLDVFGEIMVSLYSYHRAGGEMDDKLWKTAEAVVEQAIAHWRQPDRGIWEIRSEPRHFTFSKVMCWAAVDRGIKLARRCGREADLVLWREIRDEIKETVLREGWSEERGSFTQSFGATALDASLLFLPMVGFLPGDDPRIRSTVEAIREELSADGGLLMRYIRGEADDGVPGSEGSFTMCTLWMAGALIVCGQLEEAEALLEKVISMGNHVGLYSEMLDPETGAYLGNYPQAFTHIALIHTIRNLDRALGKR